MWLRVLTHLIRKVKTKTRRLPGKKAVIEQQVEFELQDQQAALDKILKAHGTYRDGEKDVPMPQVNVGEGGTLYQQFTITPGKVD